MPSIRWALAAPASFALLGAGCAGSGDFASSPSGTAATQGDGATSTVEAMTAFEPDLAVIANDAIDRQRSRCESRRCRHSAPRKPAAHNENR